ncbi:MAG: PAS domain S-box-containing protein, partial [Bradymonadia bacterium]
SWTDITARKVAEAEVSRISAELTQLIDTANAPIFGVDALMQVNEWNQSSASITGYEKAEVLGRNLVSDFITDEYRESVRSVLAAALAGKETSNYEFPLFTKSGSRVEVLLNASTRRDVEGNIVGVVGVGQDITARKVAEAEVSRIGAELTQLIDTANAPIFGVDAWMQVNEWNQSSASITGYEKAEVLGRNLVSDFITDEYRESVRSVLASALAGEETSNYEFPLFTKSGSRVEVLLNASSRRDVEGNIVGVVGVGQDITARKVAEAELKDERVQLTVRVAERTAELSAANTDLAAASRAKDEFLAGMSHELRTPLNAILNLSESLREGVYGSMNERQERSVGMVEESGRHLLLLINDILDLAKVESGTIRLSMALVNAEDICQASVRFIKESAQRKRLKVIISFDQRVTSIRADERRLKQILVNLLTNAVKFTPEGGTIGLEVTGNSEDNSVQFSVWDTGIGISPDEQSRLFTPFVQLDAGLDRKYEGTGLGLSLVAAMADMQGGSVEVTSLGHGQGSRFTISLPWSETLSVRSSHASSDTVLSLDTSHVSGVNFEEAPGAEPEMDSEPLLLLAEDNEYNITSICDFLQAEGYRLVVARNGVEAIELTRRERPDLILMDIQMPKLDGLSATIEIRKDPEFSGVPIVALTALAMSGDRERCLAAGANEYLSKPVSLRQLSDAIKILLSVSHE